MSQTFPPSPATPQIGKVALYYGLRAGLLLGIGQSVLIVYDHYGPDTPFGALTTPTSLLLWIGGFLLVGVLAAKKLGKTSIGTLAGLWAGLIGGVITAGMILFEEVSGYLGYGFDFGSIISMTAATLTGLIFLVLFTMATGTGLGALGGLIGQSFFARTPVTLPPQYQKHEAPQQQEHK